MKSYVTLALLVIVGLTAFPVLAQTCTTTVSSGASLTSAVQNVAAGGTVCLNAGTYSYSGNVSKSAMTYIQPSSGVSQANVTLTSINVTGGSNLTFQGVTVTSSGAQINTSSGSATSATHIYIKNSRFTAPVCIYTPSSMANADIVLDGNTFAGVGQGCTEGRVGINGLNVSHNSDNGVIIRNNVFGPGGASDGIQLTGSARGTQIRNNEFTGIKQSGCGTVHCDPIQFYGAERTVIDGNYFHGNSTGIMSPDGNGGPFTFTNNVMVTDGEYPDQIVIGGQSGDVINHNTFANGARVRLGKINTGSFSTNETITNNVITGGLYLTEGQTTSGFTLDYNLSSSSNAIGTHGIKGSPTYAGGTSPTSLSGYDLASGSLGTNAASDLENMGVIFATRAEGPVPPTNLLVTVH